LLTGLQFWISYVGYRKKGYAVREKDILFRHGILSTTTTIIPFNRIQHVAIHEGFFSRMYDLSELQIYTAGGSSSDLHIPGLPKYEAEQIKTFLLNQITSFTLKETKALIETESKIEEVEHIKAEDQTELLDKDDV
jgi:membrane protein YdbS with pleckstrin-like domain